MYASEHGRLRMRRVKSPNKAKLERLVYILSERGGRYLERQGLLVRDMNNSYLALEPRDEAGLEQSLGNIRETFDTGRTKRLTVNMVAMSA